MTQSSSRVGILCTLLGAFLMATTMHASDAMGAGLCCAISFVNAKTGMVTVRDNAAGRTFQFKVNQKTRDGRALLQKLKVGQKVSADLGKKAVRVSSAAVFPIFGSEKPCPCGQHTDGSCACGCGIPECVFFCGIGQCRNGVGLPGGRPVLMKP